MGDDSRVVPGGSGQLAPVTRLLLQTAHDGALGHSAHREHIAYVELGFLAAVHELASVDALGGDEQLRPLLKPVRIPEDDLGEGCPAARVVDDVLHDALDVAVPLGEVHGAQTRSALAVLHVRAEHGAGALSLPTDDAAHSGQKQPPRVGKAMRT